MKNYHYKSIKATFLGLAIMAMFVVSCDQPIIPIAPKGIEYSVYGPLNIGESPNYIRVHDTNDLLNPVETKTLNVNMTFTNMGTSESELLEDSVVVFDDLHTHNYRTDIPIEFGSQYKVLWEDDQGFTDSVITQTTKESQMSVFPDTVSCEGFLYATLTNIDLEAGEIIEPEVAVQFSGDWYWSFRRHYSSYNENTNTLTVGFIPGAVICNIFGCIPPPSPTCSDASSNLVRFRFRHTGYMLNRHAPNDLDLESLDGSPLLQQVVLGTYSKETHVVMDDSIFAQE